MDSISQPTKLSFDFSGSRHLICVESKGLETVYTTLEELKHLPDNIHILQVGETVIELIQSSRRQYFQPNFERKDLNNEALFDVDEHYDTEVEQRNNILKQGKTGRFTLPKLFSLII